MSEARERPGARRLRPDRPVRHRRFARRGFRAIGVARHFAASQGQTCSTSSCRSWRMEPAALARPDRARGIDVIVNCLGVLQDGPGSDTGAVHRDFVARLVAGDQRLAGARAPDPYLDARRARGRPHRLQPDQARGRAADPASGVAYAILRPGFVIAPTAFGGSALMRALAALPLSFPRRKRQRRFSPWQSRISPRRSPGSRPRYRRQGREAVTWELMQPEASDAGRCHRAIFACRSDRTMAAPHAAAASCSTRRAARRPRRAGSAGCRRCARPRWPSCGAAWRAIRERGWLRPASCRDRCRNRRPALRHHPGQMVRAAVPDQGAGDREPGRCSGSSPASSRS